MTAMTAAAEQSSTAARITRQDQSASILFAEGRTSIGIRAGTMIELAGKTHTFDADTPVALGELFSGRDYGVGLDADGKPYAALAGTPDPIADGWIAGFHFAPGGRAEGTAGGDAIPAINPYSLWDLDFRPSCRDPRGMTRIENAAGKIVWVDIYLLGVDHRRHGTSHCGAVIADGRDLPERPDGDGKCKKLDYATADEIYSHHGKRLIGADEFFVAAYGVKERCSRDSEPDVTGAMTDGAERFISQRGMFDATGTMWQWGTDGHPDDPRPSIFGGSWLSGGDAGSRCAFLVLWPVYSYVSISARGACDHLTPA